MIPIDMQSLIVELWSREEDRFAFWPTLLRRCSVRSFAEIGVWEGRFAEAVLRAVSSVQRYVMVDPWRPLANWNKPLNVTAQTFAEAREKALARTEFAAERRVVLEGTTLEVAERIADDSLDAVYIDGDHTLRGITLDLLALYAKVREGGMIGGDDFATSVWQHSREFEPTLVCPFAIHFAEAMGVPFYAMPKHQFLIHKSTPQGFRFVDLTGRYGDVSLRRMMVGAGTSD